MNTYNHHDNRAIDLAAELFSNVTPYSVETALVRGIVVEVTKWVPRDIGFGPAEYRTQVVLTARLWDTLLQAYVRRRNGNPEELARHHNDILWLAAQAMQQREAFSSGAANFSMYLPTGDGRNCKTVRVERLRHKVGKKCLVTIGFPEDFVTLP